MGMNKILDKHLGTMIEILTYGSKSATFAWPSHCYSLYGSVFSENSSESYLKVLDGC